MKVVIIFTIAIACTLFSNAQETKNELSINSTVFNGIFEFQEGSFSGSGIEARYDRRIYKKLIAFGSVGYYGVQYVRQNQDNIDRTDSGIALSYLFGIAYPIVEKDKFSLRGELGSRMLDTDLFLESIEATLGLQASYEIADRIPVNLSVYHTFFESFGTGVRLGIGYRF
ncbi:MAG: hypothetical protein LAT68_08920 [Cyclobacteriaceae bacterium]|nr:hypothetical protein [Cyclobacteriaceae bacterium]MCH8516437.1 hypothetical protein [Cyclobacteriaceae bacterium]